MALIGKGTQILPNTKKDSLHKEVWKATYKVFNYGGRCIVQIDTYGTNDREVKDEPSQILQMEWGQFVTMFSGMLEQVGLEPNEVCNMKQLNDVSEGGNCEAKIVL